MIIGVVGSIGSGKGTVADYLANFHSFRCESFAASLKDAVSVIFGWDRTLLEGRTQESRVWREKQDEWWTKRLGINITPRWVLQNWGTEVCRDGFHQDIWIASLENKLRRSKDNIVISDCRFPNEFQAIRAAGGKIIRVKRGPEPDWHPYVKDALRGDSISKSILLRRYGVHESEWAWYGLEFDVIIENNGSISDLYNSVQTHVIGQDEDPLASNISLLDVVSVDSWSTLF
jgi:hypothetical protein